MIIIAKSIQILNIKVNNHLFYPIFKPASHQHNSSPPIRVGQERGCVEHSGSRAHQLRCLYLQSHQTSCENQPKLKQGCRCAIHSVHVAVSSVSSRLIGMLITSKLSSASRMCSVTAVARGSKSATIRARESPYSSDWVTAKVLPK